MAKLETCANCQRAIGVLETPRLFNDHIVCAACYSLLVAARFDGDCTVANSDHFADRRYVTRAARTASCTAGRVRRTAAGAESRTFPRADCQSSPVIHVHIPAPIAAQPAPTQPAVVQPPVFHHTTQVHVANHSTPPTRVIVKSSGDGCLASLFKLIGAVVVLAALVAAAAIYFGKLDRKYLPIIPVPATTQRTNGSVRASLPETKPARGSSSAAKRFAPTSGVSPTSQPPMSASRRQQIAAAETTCLAALHNQPDYVTAKQAADELEAKVKAARADPQQKTLLATLAQQWIDAKNNLAKMESDALANDPAVRSERLTKRITKGSRNLSRVSCENAARAATPETTTTPKPRRRVRGPRRFGRTRRWIRWRRRR